MPQISFSIFQLSSLCELRNEGRTFNSLPNDKNLDVTKLKAFTDDKLNVAKMMIQLFNWVENTVGKKGENAG